MNEPFKKTASVVLYLIFIVVAPVALTLHSVESPVNISQTSDNPTPLGYTISLSLFLFPMIALLIWMVRYNKLTFQKKAFIYCIALLAPIGILLDVLFGNTFFTFENHGAVLGITFPAVGGPLPIEELVFYVTGFATVLLIYVWCDEFWFEKYNVPDYEKKCKDVHAIQFHWPSVLIGLGLILLSIIYKKVISQYPDGFPWYFGYITIAALIPSIALYKSVSAFINWRAFSFTFFIIVLISLIWETTLALPYQWWGYQDNAMMGLYINAWYRLPIEAIMIWFSVNYATVIVFETIKIWLVSNKSLVEFLLKKK